MIADLFEIMPWDYFLLPSERTYWLHLLVSAIIAFVLTALKRRDILHFKTFKNYCCAKDMRLDLQYFVLIWFIKMAIISPLLLSATFTALWFRAFFSRYFEPIFYPLNYSYLVAAYSISLFIVSDFTRYWLHRIMHTWRYLWPFHKVHHSAQTLTPLTFYRVHPLENFLFGLRYALSAGVITGLFMALFGARFGKWTIVGVNAIAFIFNLIGSNLRHSHIRLSYGAWLEYIFLSPAQHQIHHSDRHYHYNYGGSLAIWDWMFGTLKRVVDVPQQWRFGLGKNQWNKYDSLPKMIFYPFVETSRKLRHDIKNTRRRRENHK